MKTKAPTVLVLFLVLATFIPACSSAQVTWRYYSKALGNHEYNLIFEATIDSSWYVYSQNIPITDGPSPVATTINYDTEEGKVFKLIGPNKEAGDGRLELDELLFDNLHLVKYGAKKMTITQRIKVLDFSQPIKGYLTYMPFTHNKCKPPIDVDFSFQLGRVSSVKKN